MKEKLDVIEIKHSIWQRYFRRWGLCM